MSLAHQKMSGLEENNERWATIGSSAQMGPSKQNEDYQESWAGINLSSDQKLRSLVYGSANKSEEKEQKGEEKKNGGKEATLEVSLENGLPCEATKRPGLGEIFLPNAQQLRGHVHSSIGRIKVRGE